MQKISITPALERADIRQTATIGQGDAETFIRQALY